MIDKDLIINKEDFLKQELITTLKAIINDTNKNNIDDSILQIKNNLEEFNIISKSSFNIEETILDENTIKNLIDLISNTKHYNLKKTAFENLEPFIKDSLITVGAESSVGKTSFATQLSLDILENNKDTILAFYSLDDSKIFLTKKIINYLLTKNNIKNYKDEDLESIINIHKNDFLKLINNKRIAIFENMHIYNLYSELLMLKKNAVENLNIKEPRIIVVIDYLQIINHESNNLREGLNKTCKDLKDIQKKLNCMMILLSQFNRLPILSRENRKLNSVKTLNRYRETSEIENVSDVCINLESVKNKEYNIKLYVVKNKSGVKDKTFVSFRNAYTFSLFSSQIKKNAAKKLDFIEDDNYNIDDLIF